MTTPSPVPRLVWAFPLVILVTMALLSIASTPNEPRELVQRKLARAYGAPVGWAGSTPSEVISRLGEKVLGVDPAPSRTLLALPPGSTTTNSGGRLVFAQVGDGVIPGQSRFMQTTFILANDSTYTVDATLALFDDVGNPLTVTIGGVQSSAFSFTMTPGTLKRMVTSGQGNVKVGWARVTSDQPLAGTSNFSVRDPQGNIYSDVGCSEAVLSEEITLFADTMGQANTGLAVVNNDSNSVDLSFELRNPGGTVLKTQARSLPPRGHLALYVDELFSGVAGIGEFEGSVVIKGNRKFGGLTLRTVGDQLTSVPMITAADPYDLRTRMAFPQVANGTASGLKIVTTVLLFNNTAQATTGTVEFLKSDGTPMTVTVGGQTGSSFDYTLSARGCRRMMTSGAGVMQAGWARVKMERPIQGSAIYHIFTHPAGQLLTEVGVGASRLMQRFNVIADSIGAVRTGFAMANPDENGQQAKVTLILLDSLGVQKSQKTVTLEAGRQQALFLDESPLFNDVPGIGEMEGYVAVSADTSLASVVAMTLRQTGTLTTSVPLTMPVHGFAPVSTLEVTQDLAGTAPAVRWRIEQPNVDMSLEQLTVSAPQLGLDTTGLRPGDEIGYGYYLLNTSLGSFGGIIKLVVTRLGSVEFDAIASGPLLEPGIVLLSGQATGTVSSGLTLQLGPTGTANGEWNSGLGLELDLMLRPGLIRTPALPGTINLTTTYSSASIKLDEAAVRLTRQTVQPQTLVAANTAAPRIHRVQPVFFTPGMAATAHGEGFGAKPRVVFPAAGGRTTSAQPATVGTTTLDLLVPADAIPGSVRVDNGTAIGNSMFASSLFTPTMTMTRTNPTGGTSVLLKCAVSTPARQLGMQQFTARLFNVTRTLSGLSADAPVGDGKLTGATSTTAITEYDLKVESSTAERLVVKVGRKGSSSVTARITIEKISGETSGLVLTYSPNSLSQIPAVYGFATQLELNLSGLAVTLATANATPLWEAEIVSLPSDIYGAGTGIRVSPIGGILN